MLKETLPPFYSKTISPFAIAVSGGGDSMALLHALRNAPKLHCALIVDHGLRKASFHEAKLTKRRAEALGITAQILSWKPGALKSGLQEKARKARYNLMGDFCRSKKIPLLLTAHHQDDQAETLVMRYDNGTDWRGAAGMSPEKYAPLWPQLAEVTLCRPLLSVSKSEILAYLYDKELDWVEDPSNSNREFTRVRIRQSLQETPKYVGSLLGAAGDLQKAKSKERNILAEQADIIVSLDKNGSAVISDIPYPQLLVHLVRIVSGTGGPIDQAKIRRALNAMRASDFKALTLAGAQISKNAKGFLLCRDAVAVKGRYNKKQTATDGQFLPVGVPYIWDGRFTATAVRGDITVTPLYGNMTKLPKILAETVKKYPPAVRMTLPLWQNGANILGVGEGESEGISVRCLAKRRLEAALGQKAHYEQ
ncbi:tRNA lysidine(34) synthetase TilS [Litorimonas sp.]|uniref:tRNA lysidine(34) synthetase TilS n=1 Tax=Litorimonas sp. TaxID=1892381 RepID=UPI003A873369